jgi:hypothetical protein
MRIANGLAMTPSNLKLSKLDRENLQMACMHSKFLVHQLLESLSLVACQLLEQFKKLSLGLTQTERRKKGTDLPFLLS